MNYSIFIPILSIQQLMVDNSKFYKKYSFRKGEKYQLFERKYPIQGYGRAIIDIIIQPENKICVAIKKKGMKPDYMVLTGLIDTGASISVIKEECIKHLKLKPFPGAKIAGLNKKVQQVKNVNLSIHIQNVFPDMSFLDICPAVIQFANTEIKHDFIIGWDVLKYCHFDYNNPNGYFNLKFIRQVNTPLN